MADSAEVPKQATLPSFDAEALAREARAHGLVVLAGAGVSMGPPSSLPGWTAINNAFVETLAFTIAQHTDGEVGYDIGEFVAARRDEAGVAAPDLQAQFAEESLGDAYFGLFQPLDIAAWNESSAAIAAIARSGVLRAVITTNFDRLIELACRPTASTTRSIARRKSSIGPPKASPTRRSRSSKCTARSIVATRWSIR